MDEQKLLSAISDILDEKLEEKLEQKLDERFRQIDERFDRMDERMDHMDERFDQLDGKVDHMDNRLKSVELTLENETNRNIRIIAEGHLDLSRKLEDALRVNLEKEMTLVRLTTVENEVRKLKEKIS